MKYMLILLLSILTVSAFAQADEKIRSIDVIRQGIDENLDNYEKENKLIDSNTSKCIYTLDKELKLIAVEVDEQGIHKNVKWYFENNQLIFSETIWKNSKSGKLMEDEKMYVNNNNLLAYFMFENKVDPESPDFKIVADKLLKDFDAVKEKLRK